MVTIAQLRKDVIELRSLADRQALESVNPVIIFDPDRGQPDLSGLPDGGFYVCIADNGRDHVDLWDGPYIDSPDPSGPRGCTILNLRVEDCGEEAV